MNKRGELAVVAALLCGTAAGVALGALFRRRPGAVRAPHAPPDALAAPHELTPARDGRASIAMPFAAPERLPLRRATYETVRTGSPRIGRAAVTAAGAGAMLTGAILTVIAVVNPQVTALAAPTVAYSGTTAVVAYAAAGFGSFSYGLDAPSRRRTGALAAREGAFEIPITQRDANGDIVVVVRAAGPFGSDVRVARIRVLARPRAVVTRLAWNGVRIDALSLDAATVASGSEIAIRYRSNATSGSVTLRDARGGTWQSKPLSASGLTLLRAPASDRDVPFIVALRARRNGASVENSVALVVTGTARPLASQVASPAAAPPAATADIPTVARSGAVLITSAGAGRTATVIELTGTGGVALQRVTPRADGTSELRMPVVTSPQSYLISVSYQSGAGRESSFHWIRVVPAAAAGTAAGPRSSL